MNDQYDYEHKENEVEDEFRWIFRVEDEIPELCRGCIFAGQCTACLED